MSTWWWVLVGTGLYFVLSVLVGLAIAAILGQIGREIPELFEGEDWASAPLAREMGKEAEEEAADPQRRSAPLSTRIAAKRRDRNYFVGAGRRRSD